MKVLHCADSHLGFSAFRRVSDSGINVRELDVYKAFESVIDRILDLKPDVVIHAGDLFDGVRPNNRALSVALEQLLRLDAAGIPVVLVAGNHETPRLRETGHIFKVFEHLKNVYAIFQGYEQICFDLEGKKLIVHGLPHMRNREEFEEQLARVAPVESAELNILVAHGGVVEIPAFSMHESNEVLLPIDRFESIFEYVALGHYHNYSVVNGRGNVLYSGSLEQLSFAEANSQKGFVLASFDEKTGLSTRFETCEIRGMIDCPPLRCENLDAQEVNMQLFRLIDSYDFAGKMVRISLEEVSSSVYRGLDLQAVRKACRAALHLEIRAEVVREGVRRLSGEQRLESLSSEWKSFVGQKKAKDASGLESLGLEYISRVEEG